MKTLEKKYFSLFKIDFTANKIFAVFLLIVLIGIYHHYKLFEHFVDAAQSAKDKAKEEAAAKAAKAKVDTESALKKKVIARKQEDAANPETKSSSKPLEVSDNKPLYVNDPGLFDESTLDKRTQSYIQKQVASMVPAMMETFEQLPPSLPYGYSKW